MLIDDAANNYCKASWYCNACWKFYIILFIQIPVFLAGITLIILCFPCPMGILHLKTKMCEYFVCSSWMMGKKRHNCVYFLYDCWIIGNRGMCISFQLMNDGKWKLVCVLYVATEWWKRKACLLYFVSGCWMMGNNDLCLIWLLDDRKQNACVCFLSGCWITRNIRYWMTENKGL